MPKSAAPRLVRKSNRVQRSRTRKSPAPEKRSPQRRRTAEEQLVGFPLKRVFDVHTWINDGKLVTKSSLAKEWGVSTCTVKRALQFMRNRLEMPIEWDDARRTFYYSRSFPTLPFLILTRQEALVIALAARVCGGMFGPTFGRLFDGILRKIAPALGSAVARAFKSIQHVHAPAATTAADEFALLLPLLDAIESRRVVQFNHTKLDAPTAEPRRVHPLDISLLENQLRLIAYDPSRGGERDFKLARIRDLVSLDEMFERPADFDAKQRVGDSVGAHAGGETQEIRIALDSVATAYARECAWHHSQVLTPRPDDRSEMILRTGDLFGIKHRVLRWGKHVEVLAPVKLREEMHAELQATLHYYSKR